MNSEFGTVATANFQFTVNSSGTLTGKIVSSGSEPGFALNGNSTYNSNVAPTTPNATYPSGTFQITFSPVI